MPNNTLNFSTFFLLLAALLVLSACQPIEPPAQTESESEPASEIGAEPDVIVLRAGTGDSGEGLNPHQSIIADYEDQNPDVLVQLEAIAGRDYYTRILTQIAADRAPDVMNIGDDAVPSFVEKGAFLSPGRMSGRIWILTPRSICPGCWNPAPSMANCISSQRITQRWRFTTTSHF